MYTLTVAYDDGNISNFHYESGRFTRNEMLSCMREVSDDGGVTSVTLYQDNVYVDSHTGIDHRELEDESE